MTRAGVLRAVAAVGLVGVIMLTGACGSADIGGSAEPADTVGPTDSPAPTRSTVAARPTDVERVVPVDAAGQAVAGFSVKPGGAQVSMCAASPAGTGPDIVSCSPSAAGADVCWVVADRHSLLCGGMPWEKELYSAHSAETIPLVEPRGEAVPWGLELADGSRCRLRNGGAGGARPDGLVGAYFCGTDGTRAVLVDPNDPNGAVDRSGPTWTVRVGELGESGDSLPPPENLAVRTAYLAASP